MPGTKYASIQNPRMYRALRRRGYDKTAAARISNARTPGHTVKAPDYGARAGQTIAGRLVRGAGGRFAASGSAEATPREQRAEATRQAREQRRTQAQQEEADLRAQEDAQIAAAPRKQRAALRRQIAADRRQRTVKRREAENQARAQERENERQARVDEEAAQPKKGGGGGKKKPTDEEKRAAEKAFGVFKDADGADRWISLTTTAYEDRDNEIITTRGIRHAVTYGDVTGERGVLRFWHVPGLDLGACDFQATAANDRILVESGTFYSPLHAQVGRAMARKGWRMSPGFYHPQTEPYAATVNGRRVGLYDSPMIFERSGAPPNRASNLFSAYLTVKDNRMDETKKAALKELVGGNDELLSQLLAQIEQTDKTAQASGVAFKADGEMSADTAMMEPEPEMEAEEEGDAAIITAAEAQLIAQAVVEALAPMLTELKTGMDIEKKMSGYVNEMKGMLGGVAQKDDARAQETAALQAQIAELTNRLKTLEGDAPRSVQRDIGQPITITEAQAAAIKAVDGTQWTGLDSFLTGFGLNGAAR